MTFIQSKDGYMKSVGIREVTNTRLWDTGVCAHWGHQWVSFGGGVTHQ